MFLGLLYLVLVKNCEHFIPWWLETRGKRCAQNLRQVAAVFVRGTLDMRGWRVRSTGSSLLLCMQRASQVAERTYGHPGADRI